MARRARSTNGASRIRFRTRLAQTSRAVVQHIVDKQIAVCTEGFFAQFALVSPRIRRCLDLDTGLMRTQE